jgi:3-methylcrotonyl-CoA carboxylase alpha subunit
VSLFERDCSVQRRHQKVIEEAPAPSFSSSLRQSVSHAACQAARAVGYVGAGTVEFLVDREGGFHFMEMNTRLQVEHPVTEMITGLDLVEWQLRIAAGEPLPLKQDQLTLYGHSIEARIYAEDPAHDFLPSIGTLIHLKPPPTSSHVRIDTGVKQGDTITPYYDPMIAKLIVWDETRDRALQRMTTALAEYQIVGVANNIGFLRRLVSSRSFTHADLDTSLIDRERDCLSFQAKNPPVAATVLAVISVLLRELTHVLSEEVQSPWSMRDGWRLNATYKRNLVFNHGEHSITAVVEYLPSHYSVTMGEATCSVRGELQANDNIVAIVDGQRVRGTVVPLQQSLMVFYEGESYQLSFIDPLAIASQDHAKESSLLAPMPGRIVAQLVEPGVIVEKGAPLIVLEAMKMECTIHAPAAGRVHSFHFATGDQVNEGVELLRFDPELSSAEGQ